MARTVIPVTVLTGGFLAKTDLSFVAGDAANNHEIDMTYNRNTFLLIRNTGSNSIACFIAHRAGKSSQDIQIVNSITVGANEYHAIRLDQPGDLYRTDGDTYSASTILISSDGNFGDLRLGAYAWPSPRNYK